MRVLNEAHKCSEWNCTHLGWLPNAMDSSDVHLMCLDSHQRRAVAPTVQYSKRTRPNAASVHSAPYTHTESTHSVCFVRVLRSWTFDSFYWCDSVCWALCMWTCSRAMLPSKRTISVPPDAVRSALRHGCLCPTAVRAHN